MIGWLFAVWFSLIGFATSLINVKPQYLNAWGLLFLTTFFGYTILLCSKEK